MQTDYQIIANGEDVTAMFKGALISLLITDEAGIKSDAAEITIKDIGYKYALPPRGAELQIALGFDGKLTQMGKFIVDEYSGEIMPSTLTIYAKAANMMGGIRARKTRKWEDVSIGDIVAKIANEHGLKQQVSDDVKAYR